MNKPSRSHSATDQPAASRVRRVPQQRRSRERVERILSVATELITEKGIDAVRMNEIAERAEIPIGSLYQYFPDKATVVSTLAEHYNAKGQACVESLLTNVTSDADLQAALLNIVDGYYGEYLKEPVMRDIWRATQADKALQELDTADCEAHATMLHNTLKKLRPENNRTALRTLSSLIMQQVAAAVRHAISLNRTQGDATIGMFKRMLSTSLPGALEHSGKRETKPRQAAIRSRARK
jgi:AcrR family transcriptional regulator